MKRHITTKLPVIAAVLAMLLPVGSYAAPDLADFSLVFSDEFNTSTLDSSKWDTGFLWGPYLQINNEEQLYVDEFGINAGSMLSNGGQTPSPFEMTGSSLKISAVPASNSTRPSRPAENDPIWANYPEYRYNPDYSPADAKYLSGTITSYDAFRFTHGYAEARVKLPYGQGLWPAFWLLTSFYVEDVPEIDIMEFLGHDRETLYHTYHHFEPLNGWNLVSTPSYQSKHADWTADWHTFGVVWDPEKIVWYVDGVEARRITSDEYTIPNQAMYVIANLAVGGNWPGPADDSTEFPAEYELDYIRVYQREAPDVVTQAVLDEDYYLMFEDNFNGNALDDEKWNTHHLWGPYWQINAESQFYPDVLDTHAGESYDTPPISVSNGTLKITADSVDATDLPVMPAITSNAFQNHREWRHNEAYNNPDYQSSGNDPSLAAAPFLPDYTSGILTTYDSFKFTHGYAEIRGKLPKGDGLWPAFWLLNGYYVDQQPEIDIVETRGEIPAELVHSYHLSPTQGEEPSYTWSTFSNDTEQGFTGSFHTYGVSWTPDRIDYYVDGVKRHSHTGSTVSTQLMYVILNLAVGGNFNFEAVDESILPATFEIDYVRVYQMRGATGSDSAAIDAVDPVGTIDAPVADATLDTDGAFTVFGSSSDTASGVKRVQVRVEQITTAPIRFWDGSVWTTDVAWQDAVIDASGSWTLEGVDLSTPGNYRARLWIQDNAGNVATPAELPVVSFAVASTVIDTTDPQGTIVSPAAATTVDIDNAYTVSGSYLDSDSGIKRVQVRVEQLSSSPIRFWNGSIWSTSVAWQDAVIDGNGSWALEGVNLSTPGSYRVRLWMQDQAGNVATAGELPLAAFTVENNVPDSTDPQGTIISPAASVILDPDNAFTVSGSYLDADSGVKRVQVRVEQITSLPIRFWNGSGWTTAVTWQNAVVDGNGNWALEDVNLGTPGRYRVRLWMQDYAGNVATAAELPLTTFTVESNVPDTTDPEGTTESPIASTTIASDNDYTVSGTYLDADSGIKRIQVRVEHISTAPIRFWNGSAWVTSVVWQDAEVDGNGNWTLEGVDLTTPGDYRVRLWMLDRAGNLATPAELPITTFTTE